MHFGAEPACSDGAPVAADELAVKPSRAVARHLAIQVVGRENTHGDVPARPAAYAAARASKSSWMSQRLVPIRSTMPVRRRASRRHNDPRRTRHSLRRGHGCYKELVRRRSSFSPTIGAHLRARASGGNWPCRQYNPGTGIRRLLLDAEVGPGQEGMEGLIVGDLSDTPQEPVRRAYREGLRFSVASLWKSVGSWPIGSTHRIVNATPPTRSTCRKPGDIPFLPVDQARADHQSKYCASLGIDIRHHCSPALTRFIE
jgi:hypothetical protein